MKYETKSKMKYGEEELWFPLSEDLLSWDREFQALMLNDYIRMVNYEAAIKESVKPGMVILDLGTGTGILAKLGLHRGYIYDTLERMQEKEVVNHILKNNKKYFQATSPENLVELLKFKLENLQKIVPKLLELIETPKEKTKVEVHKGKRVYRTLLKDITATAKKNDTILLIGVDERTLLEEVEPIYLRQYFTIIKEKNIKEKVIMKKGKKKYTIPNVTHKFLDEKYIGNVEQILYGNKVATFILGDPNYLIVTENKDVAETYKKQFELLWSIAKP